MATAWLRRHRRRLLSGTAAVGVVAVLSAIAVTSTGYRTQNTELDDAAVWVVNDQDGAVGRANLEVGELNSAFPVDSAELDVLQRGDTVVVVDRGRSSLSLVDVATATPGDEIPLPSGTETVGLAGDRVVVVADGDVWVVPLDGLQDFDASAEATLRFGEGAVSALSPDGRLAVYSPSVGEVSSFDAATEDGPSETTAVDPFDGDDVRITLVGDSVVLLDTENGVLDVDGDRRTLDESTAGAELQSPSDVGDSVAVALSSGLLEVPLASGDPSRVADAQGSPSAPMAIGDCLYGAWGDGSLWERCGSSAPRSAVLDGLGESSAATFRENRGRVLLNDGRSGRSWAVQDGDTLIDNWQDLLDDDEDRQDVEQNDEDAPPDYETRPSPPVAADDAFGARPGRTSPLPVLINDYDPNGDVLVIDDVGTIAEDLGRIDVVSDGQALQVSLSDEASGSFTFDYTVSDGRGGSSTATVEVDVRDPDENAAPVQVRAPKTLVSAGGRVSTNALTTWYDPDGDPFYLDSATAVDPELAVSKPDGTVVFTSSGDIVGRSDVALVASDGRLEGAGRLSVTIRDGDVPIIVEPFAAIAHTNEEITVQPLAHARGGVDEIRLAGVSDRDGVVLVPDYDAGSFRLTVAAPGVYYVDFSVTDGTTTTTGAVRVQVTTPPSVGAAPVAAPHTVFVRAGTPYTVDVLETDRDPAGGVLLVTDADTESVAASMRVEVLEQRSVRVVLTGPLAEPVSFPYTISNGYAATTGSITVIEIPEPVRPQPPIATADTVSVRVGDVVDIPVLDNDEHPDGSRLTLATELPRGLPEGGGLAFVSGEVVRYLAPSTPGDFTVTYRVLGPDGQWADADVTLSVREIDPTSNTAPAPRTVTARVFAGETVRVEIPLSGIDPDGDSVQLVGQSSSPERGSVVASGATWFDYEAGAYAAGTDTFEYTVVDALGAQSTGTVRIGVSTRADAARNPVAVEDLVITRPSRTVTIPVLENDSDPDGGAIEIASVEASDSSIVASIVGDSVDVVVPAAEGRYGLVYTIANERGGTSSNFITVVVDQDAAPAVPVARDSIVRVEDVLDRDSVTVDVLANVRYVDGPVSELSVGVPERYADVATVDGDGEIVVRIGDASQVIPFRVWNPAEEGVEGWAFVRVPGLDDALPQLRSTADPLTVRSGETVRIDLPDYVVAIGDRGVRIAGSSSVSATHADGDDLVVDDDTLEFTSADAYFGPASITFRVTDGTSADDPDGRVATLVLPITVTPRDNQPPVFSGGSIDVEPGTTRTLDLARLTTYPYPDNLDALSFSVAAPAPEGIEVSIDGRSLTVDVASTAPVGSIGTLSIGVSDDASTGTAGSIDFRVVPSTLPLAVPQPDAVQLARGSTETIDVLANDGATNPFPDTPLRVVDVRGVAGGSLPSGVSVSPSADRSVLTVSVSADATIADAVLQYQVADATGDSSRYVWGTVRISVQDRPEPVTALALRSAGDRSLTFGWTPGSFNNAAIQSFTVVLTNAATGAAISSTSCSSSTCAVTTPGNGRENAVRVQVTATNAVGTSDPTALGTPVWSDLIPPAPENLTSTPLDGGLRVSWTKPADTSTASPIIAYDVTVGGVTQTQTVSRSDPAGTRYVRWIQSPSIPNGTPVTVTVQSRNDFAGAAPQWNTAAGSNTPAGAPIAGAAPTAEADQSSGTRVSVTWAGVFSGNGAAIQRYYVALSSDGTLPSCRVDGVADGNPQLRLSDPDGELVDVGTATTYTFRGLTPNTDYRAVVFAYNGQGCTESAQVSATPLQRPGTPTASFGRLAKFSSGLYSYVADVDYTSAGGAQSTTVSYRSAGGGFTSEGVLDDSGFIVPSDQQWGYVLQVQFQVCETYGSTRLCSEWSSATPTPNAVVSTRISPQLSDLTMSFADGKPIGGQPGPYLRFSCDNFATDGIPLDVTGSCTNTPSTRGNIWVRVSLPGQPVHTDLYRL